MNASEKIAIMKDMAVKLFGSWESFIIVSLLDEQSSKVVANMASFISTVRNDTPGGDSANRISSESSSNIPVIVASHDDMMMDCHSVLKEIKKANVIARTREVIEGLGYVPASVVELEKAFHDNGYKFYSRSTIWRLFGGGYGKFLAIVLSEQQK